MFVPRWHDPDRKPRPAIAEAAVEMAAPAERVAAALFEVARGEVFAGSLPAILRAPHLMPRAKLGVLFEVSGGPDRFTIMPLPPAAGRPTHLDIDRGARLAVIHGGWWFRHEIAVAEGAFPGFSRLSCRTFNVAPGMSHRLLPIALPRHDHPRRAAETLNGLVALLGRELGIVGVPVSDSTATLAASGVR